MSVPGIAIGSNGQGESTSSTEQSQKEGTCLYTVQKGDTLSRIAAQITQKAGNYKQIMAFNELTSDLIHPGDTLKIPLQLVIKACGCTLPQSPASQTPAPILIPKDNEEILADIEGLLFEDQNGNGQHDTDEPGIEGIQVVLVRGNIIQTTDENGEFLFEDVDPGPQAVGLYETNLPDGYQLCTESTVIITVTEGDRGFVSFGVQAEPSKNTGEPMPSKK